jgi:hypothetical protein
MDFARMEAQYETECPRCLDWITPGQTIVQDPEQGWCHAVCEGDIANPRTEADTNVRETIIRFGDDGEILR